MANKKISQLSSLSQGDFAPGDSVPIVDQSSNETKRTTIADFDSRWAASVHTHVINDVTNLQTTLNNKEPIVNAGTTFQYYRGDKTFQMLDKAAVGLNLVDNTSDANKPISTAVSTALSGKANTSHTHVASQITDFTASVQDISSSDKLLSEVDDFTSATVTGRLNFVSTVSGTGAAIIRNNVISDISVFGNTQLSTGTTAIGRSSFSLALDSTYFNGIQHSIEWKMRLDALSTTGIEQFFVYCGWGDNTGAGDQVDGVYFRYDASVSTNWLAVTSSNSIREVTNTGVLATAIGYQKFSISVNSTGTQALFYINGVLVATNTLNISTSQARACGPLVKIEKSVGIGARTVQLDRVQIDSRRP
jgi:hypothetical protein